MPKLVTLIELAGDPNPKWSSKSRLCCWKSHSISLAAFGFGVGVHALTDPSGTRVFPASKGGPPELVPPPASEGPPDDVPPVVVPVVVVPELVPGPVPDVVPVVVVPVPELVPGPPEVVPVVPELLPVPEVFADPEVLPDPEAVPVPEEVPAEPPSASDGEPLPPLLEQ
jgi:hypothetical protein